MEEVSNVIVRHTNRGWPGILIQKIASGQTRSQLRCSLQSVTSPTTSHRRPKLHSQRSPKPSDPIGPTLSSSTKASQCCQETEMQFLNTSRVFGLQLRPDATRRKLPLLSMRSTSQVDRRSATAAQRPLPGGHSALQNPMGATRKSERALVLCGKLEPRRRDRDEGENCKSWRVSSAVKGWGLWSGAADIEIFGRSFAVGRTPLRSRIAAHLLNSRDPMLGAAD